VVLVFFTLMAIFAPLIAAFDPNRVDLRQVDLSPGWPHLLGTDGVGRDYLTRLVYAARVSLPVGLLAASFVAAGIGTALGTISGFFGGWVDTLIQRFTELVMTFPSLIVIITLVAYVGPGVRNVILVLGLLGWTSTCRMVRGQVLAIRELAFVEATRALGAPRHVIMIRHILPNALPYVIVLTTLNMAQFVLTEASLSFLGLGVQQPTATWGNMLHDAQTIDVLISKSWRWIAPGTAIATCVLAINFLGDGLRDALDPRSQLAPKAAQGAGGRMSEDRSVMASPP
jgi:peptide/nickel transport system permease protein